jgi:DNA mismatch repair ATPase MutS
VAIAWAVCERLASTRCFTLLATHLRQLAGLAQLHPCVKLWELSVGGVGVS